MDCIKFKETRQDEDRKEENIKFVLNGCDISFIAQAPADITLKQLLKQCDRIEPHWCACGICSLESAGFINETDVELFIDYEDIKKAKDNVSCSILEN